MEPNLERVSGHHFILLKALWPLSKSPGINVINNYGLARLTSHYLSFPDILRLSYLHLFLPAGGVRQTGDSRLSTFLARTSKAGVERTCSKQVD